MAHRPSVRLAGQRHHAEFGLQYRVEAGAVRHRPVLPIGGDGEIDQPREPFGEGGVVEAEALHHAHAEILDDDIRIRQQVEHDFLAFRRADIEGDALLVAVEGEEEMAFSRRAGLRHAPRVVAGRRILDLDDFGAHIGEYLRAERPRDDAREIHHLDAPERGRARLRHWHVVSVRVP